MRSAHRHATRAFSVILIVLGLAMLASTIARGGGVLSLGVLVGASFTALGGARLVLGRETPARG